MKQKKVGFLIIGDEILCGKTQDVNLKTLALKLGEKGYAIGEVRIVADEYEEIIFSVNELRKKYFLVFTSGGIGPTHDDITAEAISKAFNLPCEFNEEAVQLLHNHYLNLNLEFNEARKRMTRMPKGAILIENPISKAPAFKIENVCVLAGVPKIFEAMLNCFLKELPEGLKMHSLSLETEKVTEGNIALELEKVQNKLLGKVFIGSYPKMKEEGGFKLQITFRSLDEILAKQAYDEVEKIISSFV